MTGFFRDSTGLTCDGVPIGSVARHAGTPLYMYSAAAIREAYRALDAAFTPYPHTIHYALKANSTLAIVRLLRELGSHADANSGGEIEVLSPESVRARLVVGAEAILERYSA